MLFKSKKEENKEIYLFGIEYWSAETLHADPEFELMFWLLLCASYKLIFKDHLLFDAVKIDVLYMLYLVSCIQYKVEKTLGSAYLERNVYVS